MPGKRCKVCRKKIKPSPGVKPEYARGIVVMGQRICWPCTWGPSPWAKQLIRMRAVKAAADRRSA